MVEKKKPIRGKQKKVVQEAPKPAFSGIPKYVPVMENESIDLRIRNKIRDGAGVKNLINMRLWACEVLEMTNNEILEQFKLCWEKKCLYPVNKRKFVVYIAQLIMQHERDKIRAEKELKDKEAKLVGEVPAGDTPAVPEVEEAVAEKVEVADEA